MNTTLTRNRNGRAGHLISTIWIAPDKVKTRVCENAAIIITCLVAASAAAQTAREVRGAAPVEPLLNEPPAKIIIDPPLGEPLSHGRVAIQYRPDNVQIVPVFGPAPPAVSPRVGHIQVTVDDAPSVWADASGEPVVLNGLSPGPHKILVQLETANHNLMITPRAAVFQVTCCRQRVRRATRAGRFSVPDFRRIREFRRSKAPARNLIGTRNDLAIRLA
jgi:Family of unknown function (DUF6130)